MFPVVVIDIVPPEAAGQYASPMVEACTRALRTGQCALGATTSESARPESIALVSWQSADWQTASVRVRHRDRPWTTRYLDFAEDDPIEDRWTAVGLTIATLVDELTPHAPPTTSGLSPPEPERPLPPVSTGQREGQTRVAVESDATGLEVALAVGALTGPGWERGGWQSGVVSVFHVRGRNLPFIAVARASYALSDGPELLGIDLRTRWYTLSFGVGVHASVQPLNARVIAALELAGRRAVVVGVDSIGSDESLSADLRFQLSWPMRGSLGIVVGGTIGVPPVKSVTGGSTYALRGPHVSTEMLAALEVRL